ncbi:UvrD-helicase domain-containing protein [Desulfuromonas carbonis]|uniref:UvrD-helicase domain-containing protein n=1 Tax=Desulfuromonas sp. DDH964 TaxID=1823759 RepID=UPI00078D6665|nr:UvrD-helicase domain-containing protein [Desulfuromonas sp. DDH964]AMV72258.1 ATP-dependent DNA helicase PcrA [Desulfuromonas sp. DDH964]
MRVRDQSARLRALDPAQSFIVQAPAGSGKTELLTQRILSLLAVVEQPEEILAITFTRKAAGEMRHRLLQALESASLPAPGADHARQTWELAGKVMARDGARGWNLLDTPSRLAIQTIDSFNAGLARRMPWLSRFGGVPRVTDDPQRLYREAARRVLARVGGERSGAHAGARVLAYLDNRQERLERLLVSMLQRRDQWLRHLAGRSVDQERRGLEGALAAFVEEILALSESLLPGPLWEQLAPLARYAASNLEAERPLRRLAAVTDRPGAGAEDLPLWQGLADLLLTAKGDLRRRLDKSCGFPPGKADTAAAMKAAMQDCLDSDAMPGLASWLHRLRSLPAPLYGEEQWSILQDLVELLGLAAGELWLVFTASGETDFAEVALRALAGLSDGDAPSELLLRLDAGIRHLLVDEFQDTSYLQFRLLETLTEGWSPGDGRSLFLVGDPMQSIYRFREAEVGLFLRARREGVGTVPLEALHLETNFRSSASLVDWFNASFASIFPRFEEITRGAVTYSPAFSFATGKGEGAVTILPRQGRDDAAEGEEVVALTREALGRGERVAILVRARSHLGNILPLLRGAGIDYLAQDVDLLAERPLVRDLVSLTHALLHTGDRLAWLSVLRAPWCGLLLSDLARLVEGRAAATLPELLADPGRLETLSADGRERAGRVFAVLQRGRRQRGRLGLRRLVEGCWLALGGPACYPGGELEDAEQFFALLQRLDRGGDLETLEALAEALQRLYAAPDGKASGQLQVMTIHKAKGLEFDTVIIPGLGRKPGKDDPPLLAWLELPATGLLLAPIPAPGGEGDPIYKTIRDLEAERQTLEVVRLLYVAATRARERLYLLGHCEFDATGSARPPAGSLLESLWPAVAASFATHDLKLPVEVAAPNQPPAQSELRRLPATWALPDFESLPLPTASPIRPASGDDQVLQTAGLARRHAGTVLHAMLERIARDGLAAWDLKRIEGLEEELRHRLQRLGVTGADLKEAVHRVQAGMRSAVSGLHGRRILRSWPDAGCEVGLAGPALAGVVDRTFVDESGVRWVVDYKTSEPPPGENPDAFFAAEVDRYRSQLACYAQLFQGLEPERKIRAGLYFPLSDIWREVPV